MQFFDQNLGVEIDMPDNIDPNEANQAMSGLYQQEQAKQSMMQGLGWAGRTIADVMTPTRSHPVIDHRAAAAMSPQALQNTMQMQQGSIDQENRVRAQQQMQQEQMAQMNQIEQARMRQRNAETLQRQKDQRDMMKIRTQEYDMRKQQHEFEMRMKEDEMKEKERQAKMPQLHESSGMQYTYDETTNSYKGGVIPGAEAVHADFTRAPMARGGRGGSGGGASGGGASQQSQWITNPATGEKVWATYNAETGRWAAAQLDGVEGAPQQPQEDWSKWRLTDDGEGNKLWAHPDGRTRPLTPEEKKEVSIVDQGNALVGKAQGRKAKGELLLQEGWAPAQVDAYLNAIGAVDDNSWVPFKAGKQWNAGSGNAQKQQEGQRPQEGAIKEYQGATYTFVNGEWLPL